MQTVFAHRSLHEKIKEFYGFFPEHIEDRARQTTEQLLEEALKAGIDILVDAERYEGNQRRKTYRNGYYVRHLVSHHGLTYDGRREVIGYMKAMTLIPAPHAGQVSGSTTWTLLMRSLQPGEAILKGEGVRAGRTDVPFCCSPEPSMTRNEAKCRPRAGRPEKRIRPWRSLLRPLEVRAKNVNSSSHDHEFCSA